MMKVLIILGIVSVALAHPTAVIENPKEVPTQASKEANGSEDGSKYTTKYDNMNLDEILHSDRLLRGYVNCLMDKGPCTPDGTELKKNLPDSINNDCKKCNEKQKANSKSVMHYLIENKPKWWEELEQKYNPSGSYKKAFLEKSKNEQDQEKNASKEKSKEA